VGGTADKVEELQEIVSKPKIMIVNNNDNGAVSFTFMCNLLCNAGVRIPLVTNNLLGDESFHPNSDL
jgi:hypothetical protein